MGRSKVDRFKPLPYNKPIKPSLNTQYAPFTPYITGEDDSPFSACKPNTLPLEFDSSLIKDIPGGTGIFIDQYLILPGHALKSDAVLKMHAKTLNY